MHARALRIGRIGLAVLGFLAANAAAQMPDFLYYKFDEGGGATTANLATPGVGSANAAVNGHTLSPTGGQFSGSLLGVGGNGTTNNVNTGWATSLPGDWTISMWLD